MTQTITASDEWIEHEGRKCPVPAGTVIDIRYRDGSEKRTVALNATDEWRNAEARFWDTRDNHHSDIIAYRKVNP